MMQNQNRLVLPKFIFFVSIFFSVEASEFEKLITDIDTASQAADIIGEEIEATKGPIEYFSADPSQEGLEQIAAIKRQYDEEFERLYGTIVEGAEEKKPFEEQLEIEEEKRIEAEEKVGRVYETEEIRPPIEELKPEPITKIPTPPEQRLFTPEPAPIVKEAVVPSGISMQNIATTEIKESELKKTAMRTGLLKKEEIKEAEEIEDVAEQQYIEQAYGAPTPGAPGAGVPGAGVAQQYRGVPIAGRPIAGAPPRVTPVVGPKKYLGKGYTSDEEFEKDFYKLQYDIPGPILKQLRNPRPQAYNQKNLFVMNQPGYGRTGGYGAYRQRPLTVRELVSGLPHRGHNALTLLPTLETMAHKLNKNISPTNIGIFIGAILNLPNYLTKGDTINFYNVVNTPKDVAGALIKNFRVAQQYTELLRALLKNKSLKQHFRTNKGLKGQIQKELRNYEFDFDYLLKYATKSLRKWPLKSTNTPLKFAITRLDNLYNRITDIYIIKKMVKKKHAKKFFKKLALIYWNLTSIKQPDPKTVDKFAQLSNKATKRNSKLAELIQDPILIGSKYANYIRKAVKSVKIKVELAEIKRMKKSRIAHLDAILTRLKKLMENIKRDEATSP